MLMDKMISWITERIVERDVDFLNPREIVSLKMVPLVAASHFCFCVFVLKNVSDAKVISLSHLRPDTDMPCEQFGRVVLAYRRDNWSEPSMQCASLVFFVKEKKYAFTLCDRKVQQPRAFRKIYRIAV